MSKRITVTLADKRQSPVIALAGNPNSGKTTVFNALTGGDQKIGNYPGKTIERIEGICQVDDLALNIVDLPGTYSLSAYSAEEIVSMDFLLDENPDIIMVVLDASNIERNLYLAYQILEMHVPVILILNMIDEAEVRHIEIDTEKISRLLDGTPVVKTSAVKNIGIDDLKQTICRTLQAVAEKVAPDPEDLVDYGPEIESQINKLEAIIRKQIPGRLNWDTRWLAVKLLEGDDHIYARVEALPNGKQVDARVEKMLVEIEDKLEEDPGTMMVGHRYIAINNLVNQAVNREDSSSQTFSDKIDRILIHPLWGSVIFLSVLYFVFQLTANVSTPILDWISSVFSGPISSWTVGILGALNLDGTWFESLLIGGAIPGAGTLISFAPIMLLLYLCMALLEDSGYMARAAFIGDRLLNKIGLNGKSFIPLILGFGCNVPAITATRILERKRDRILTGLLIPFMSCGARLPVYTLFGIAFFGKRAGLFIIALYALGMATAVAISFILQKTLLKTDEEMPFLIELPPYRMPSFKYTWRSTWERTMGFVSSAWSLVLAVSIILWFLMAIPVGGSTASFDQVPAEESALAAVGGVIAPILEPAGFGTWEATSALVTGFVAKEIVVASLSTVYTGGENAAMPEPVTFREGLHEIGYSFVTAMVDTGKSLLSLLPGVNLIGEDGAGDDTALLTAIRSEFTPLTGVAYCVFVLLTVPCSVTVAVMHKEFGFKWTALSIANNLLSSWVLSVIVFQLGMLLGFG